MRLVRITWTLSDLAARIGLGPRQVRKMLDHRAVPVAQGEVRKPDFRRAFPSLWDELVLRGLD